MHFDSRKITKFTSAKPNSHLIKCKKINLEESIAEPLDVTSKLRERVSDMSLLATIIGKLMALSTPLKLTKSEVTERMAASETG